MNPKTEKLRKKFMDNPPEGMTFSYEIPKMPALRKHPFLNWIGTIALLCRIQDYAMMNIVT